MCDVLKRETGRLDLKRVARETALLQESCVLPILKLHQTVAFLGPDSYFDSPLIEYRFTVDENLSPSHEHRVDYYHHGVVDYDQCAGFTDDRKYRN